MIPIVAAALALLIPVRTPQAGMDAPTAAAESTVSQTARNWLALVDAGRWSDSWAATSPSFRSHNTLDAWQAASEKARVPLGRMLSRTLLSEQDIPAPPAGYRTVRFRTDFANRHDATEIVSLDRQGDGWKVVGIYIE